MNKRARTLARLKLSRACKDNPDLPRKLVFSLLVSKHQAGLAVSFECCPNAATRRTFAATDRGKGLTRCKDAGELFQKLGI